MSSDNMGILPSHKVKSNTLKYEGQNESQTGRRTGCDKSGGIIDERVT